MVDGHESRPIPDSSLPLILLSPSFQFTTPSPVSEWRLGRVLQCCEYILKGLVRLPEVYRRAGAWDGDAWVHDGFLPPLPQHARSSMPALTGHTYLSLVPLRRSPLHAPPQPGVTYPETRTPWSHLTGPETGWLPRRTPGWLPVF